MAKAYYGSRISENMTMTPEGFLICHNVPIARTGTQKYLARELGLDGNDLEIVYRYPEEVFNKATLASFEGKVFTDEHPTSWVTPDNVSNYMKGVMSNIRRGSGSETDLMFADIIVYNKTAIEEIKNGKREVSCGYECDYEKHKDGYKQLNIIGNHVSLVEAGRAGDRVAIKDSNTVESQNIEEKGGSFKMTYKLPNKKPSSSVSDFLKAVGLKTVAMDNEPEDILNAVDELAEEKLAEKERDAEPVVVETEKEEPVHDDDERYAELESKIDKALSLIESLLGEEKSEDEEVERDPELEALDDLEEELKGKEEEATDGDQMEEEESVTVDPEKFEDEDVLNGEKAMTQATDSALVLLRQFKPIIAAMPNKAERKKATDALIKQVRMTAKDSKKNSYSAMAKKSQVADNKATDADKTFIGKDIAKQFNPHYKNK